MARHIDLHALQDVPPSCLNRGFDQEPKTVRLGNTTRGMVSSQCWKREMRLDLEDQLDEHAARSRMVPAKVAAALLERGWSQAAAAEAATQIAWCASSEGLQTSPANPGQTLSMLFVPKAVITDLVAVCEKNRSAIEKEATRPNNAPTSDAATGTAPPAGRKGARSKKNSEKPKLLPTADIAALLTGRTATISMFGRMLAEIPNAGHVDGAIGVAHAWSVHTGDPQPDFFTAVEDWSTPGEHGSAHLQTAYLTAGVFYRYATVNLTELLRNLGGDRAQALFLLELFIDSFIHTLPQAKKNSTAPHTLPHLVHYAVRDRRPISLGAAFEQPVQAAHRGGHSKPAREVLNHYAASIHRLTSGRGLIGHGYVCIDDDTPLPDLGTHHHSYAQLINACAQDADAPPAPKALPRPRAAADPALTQ